MFHACICTSSLKFLYLQLAETTCMQPYYYCIEAVLQTGLFALSVHCDEISLSRALDRRDHGRITLVLLNKTPQPFPCNLQTQNSSPQTSTITHRTTTLQYSFISPPRQTHVTYVAFNVLYDLCLSPQGRWSNRRHYAFQLPGTDLAERLETTVSHLPNDSGMA